MRPLFFDVRHVRHKNSTLHLHQNKNCYAASKHDSVLPHLSLELYYYTMLGGSEILSQVPIKENPVQVFLVLRGEIGGRKINLLFLKY